jgi:hypothetical protein
MIKFIKFIVELFKETNQNQELLKNIKKYNEKKK